MGVYIRGVEMPTTCYCCRMCVQVSDGDIDWHWECCLLCEEVARYATDRIPGCPLVEIPPHGRLIDAEVAEAILFNEEEADGKDFMDGILHAADWISKQPTIIPAEEGE